MPTSDSSVIHCPDCGGVVGATETTDAGPPCRCFQDDANGFSAPASSSLDNLDPSGTHVLEAPQTAEKVCWKCGKNLAGHRRFKDSYGYWCIDCHKADKGKKEEQENAGMAPCRACGRMVKEETLTSYEGELMCSRCLRERREIKKMGAKKFRTVSDRAYKKTEFQRLFILLGILVVLALIILLRSLGVIGEHASSSSSGAPSTAQPPATTRSTH
jgi:hypothetical protein